MSPEWSIYLRYLHQHQNASVRALSWRYRQFSLPITWRHATKKIEVHPKQTKGNGERKPKLSKRDERSITWALHYARKQDGNFTLKGIKLYSGNAFKSQWCWFILWTISQKSGKINKFLGTSPNSIKQTEEVFKQIMAN